MEEKHLELLGNGERRRHERFLRPERRRQFLAGRLLLRRMLSAEFGSPIGAWRFEECPGLPPRLTSETAFPLAFSLAHSRDLAVCLVAPGGRVGVDVEYLGKGRDFLAIAARCFSSAQVRRLRSLPPEEQRVQFYRYWTLHEAVMKAGSCGNGDWSPCREKTMGSPQSVLVTTVFGDYAIAAAIGGGFSAPVTIERLRSGGSVESCPFRAWLRHEAKDVGFAEAEFPREPVTGSP
jgi:4'-phosphopantetheinyl transferase